MDRLVLFVKLAKRFLFVVDPHASGDTAAYADLRPYGIAKVISAIGAIRKHFTAIIRQCFKVCLAVVDIGRCNRNLLDQCFEKAALRSEALNVSLIERWTLNVL